MTFLKYLKEQNISYIQLDENLAEIDGKTYKYQELEDGIHFDTDFHLIHPDLGYDFHVIYFGGRYYYIPMGEEEKFELKELKYIGKPSYELETNIFLGVHSNFEILSGSRQFKDWIQKAKWLGVESLGICERNTMAGMMKFQSECQDNNIKPILGASFSVVGEKGNEYDIKLFIKNYQGWINMLTINKYKNVDGILRESDVLKLEEGLVIILDPKTISFEDTLAYDFLEDVYYQLDTVEYEDEERDKEYLENVQNFLESSYKPLPFTDAYYLDKEDSYIRDKLSEMSGNFDHKSYNQYFKSKEEYFMELSELFVHEEDMEMLFIEMLENENKLVDSCSFMIKTGERHLPEYELTEEEKEKYGDKETMFFSLIEEGLEKRYGGNYANEHLDRIEKEVNTIKKGDFIDYFLTTRDILNAAQKNDIMTSIGRGSVGGSLIAYLLEIIHIDPLRYDLLWERFLNDGRLGEFVDANIIEIELEDGTIRKYSEDEYVVIKENGKLNAVMAKDLKEDDEI